MDTNNKKEKPKKSFLEILALIVTGGLYVLVLIFEDWMRLKKQELGVGSVKEIADKEIKADKIAEANQ